MDYFDKGQFVKEIEKLTGFRIAPITLWTWEKKGLFTPSGYIMNGKQKRPVYDMNNLSDLVTRALIAKQKGSSRIKF